MSAPETAETSLVGHFSILEDPRDALRRRHRLLDMVVIAIAATLGGADGWVDMAQFGRAKEAWFRRFLDLPNGIPSHDTFGRVFSLLAPAAFEACFRAWVASIRTVIPGEIIAIDGKTLRRSHDRGKGVAALHLVSAWATANRVVLGQVATDAKSNEITAIPQLLELLMLKGTIVTIDAMGCQTKDGKVSRETRFFIGSIGTGVADFARAVRGHWGVENELHWSLDVALREDDCRVRETQARENLAVLRHIAVSRLKNDRTKLGIKTKRLKAGWDDAYLEKLLFEPPPTLRPTPPSGTSKISRG
jgi:predicted transposase YbfD/YdcC